MEVRPGGRPRYAAPVPAASVNGITIEYETFGVPGDPAVLLIMGFACQLIHWDPVFCRAMADAGYYVIRFDNRDVGLSTWFDDAGVPDLLAILGGTATSPYGIVDMADDAVGLLDALGVPTAHVVGVSMGGMIAQTVAIAHPERTRTLVSGLSSTGDPTVGQPHVEALLAVAQAPPTTRDEAIEQTVDMWRVIGSPGFPFHEDRIRERSTAAHDRADHPEGNVRQLAAIATQADRTAALAGVTVPTLVVHGTDDILVDPSGGVATAAAVPHAELRLVEGMGHDVPPELFDEFVAGLLDHFAKGS